MNPTEIESHIKFVLGQWLLIIAVAWVFGRLACRVRQPLAVGEIAAGILLGPSVLGQVSPELMHFLFPAETQQSLQLLAKIGLIFLLFQVGMEFDFGHLRTGSRTVALVALFGILAPVICGMAVGPWLHRTFAAELPYVAFQIFVCISIAISALPIMGRILIEMGLERTAIGAISISAAAIDDVVGWILLAAGTAVVKSGFAPGVMIAQILGTLVFFIVLQKLVGPWLRRLWNRLPRPDHSRDLPSSFLVLLLVVLFASCLVAHELGIFTLFGAFLLGVSLHQERSLVEAWRSRFTDFVLVAMVPIFFTNTGLRTEIGSLSSPLLWLGAAAVFLASVAGKLGGCYLGARLSGQPARESMSIAVLMNTRALMGLVAINIALELGVLTDQLFTMFVLMALITTALPGPILRICLPAPLRELVRRHDRGVPPFQENRSPADPRPGLAQPARDAPNQAASFD
jgi:Kef-type K+ transport system membrane component KefB